MKQGKFYFIINIGSGMHTSAGINLGYSLRPVTDGMLQIQILTFPSQHAFE